MAVMALYAEDGEWYPATISSFGDNCVEICFDDSGEHATVDYESIALKAGVANAPPSASPTATDSGTLLAALSKLSLATTRRKLLVLDINGLLLERIFASDLRGKPPRAADARQHGRLVFLRPHCRSFVSWCLERFEVVVWSTAMQKNVLRLVSLLFPSTDQQPAAVLHQKDCTPTGLFDPQKRGKELRLKVLARLWERPELSAADGRPYGPHNTLLLDDSPYKVMANPPHTAVHPSEWSAANSALELDEALGPDGSIRLLLDRFARADDGRHVVEAWNRTARDFWTRPQDDPKWAVLLGASEAERARWALMGGRVRQAECVCAGSGGKGGMRAS
jgi:hypothetical protein